MIIALEQVECMKRSYVFYCVRNTVDMSSEQAALKVRFFRPIQERMSVFGSEIYTVMKIVSPLY